MAGTGDVERTAVEWSIEEVVTIVVVHQCLSLSDLYLEIARLLTATEARRVRINY